jgi:Right handed beta helix region
MKTRLNLVAGLLFALVPHAVISTAYAQGSLTPPGPPGPTMKSLAQIEPRVDVLTLPGDGNYLYVISTPGSYYLTGNITNPGALGGINITVSGVTLDLSGFVVDGAGATGSGQNGITCGGGVVIRNGIVQNWNNYGISASGDGDSFEKLVLSENDADGWYCTGNHYQVTQCQSLDNSTGFNGNSGPGAFDNCYAGGNAANGFTAGSSTLLACNASQNQASGFVLTDSVLTSSTANANTVDGVFCSNSSVIDCVANNNTGDGIFCHTQSQVRGDTCDNNHGNGIEADDHNNRIDSNHCMKNTGYGIKNIDDSGGGIIVRNTCLLNTGTVTSTSTANYGAKNSSNLNPYFGAISLISTGTPSPWANF